MVMINPADCKPGEVYEGTVHGERTVLIRRDACDSYPWESLDEVLDHEDVSSLVRLVPARPITRDDLPSVAKLARASAADPTNGAGAALDAVVARVNANGGTPVVMGTAANNTLRETLANVETDRDRWRRAHAIVEQERDQARESLRRLRDETDFDLFTVRDQLKQCRGEREQMTRDRDEAVARAEAAEGRTDPAVTRAEVEKAVRSGMSGFAAALGEQCITEAVDAVCSLFGVEAEPADPVEAKARELHEVAQGDGPFIVWEALNDQERTRFCRMAAHVLGQEDRHVDQ